MARKDRAPNPPKRPQAPQRRSSPIDPAKAAQQRRLLYLIAGSGIVALAIVLAIVFLGGGGDGDDERATLTSAGCTLEVRPGLAGDHTLEIGATSAKWNTDPPTSGPHNVQPAVWGSYDEPVPLAQTVHNLEHGGIVIHYGPNVPEADVEAVRNFYNDDPNGLVVAPLAKLGDRISLEAWTTEGDVTKPTDKGKGFLAKCKSFDEDAFSSFVDDHRFKGPERFPAETLTPGS